tara:strand:+ start:1439 stop:1654 length:216 start_codon:yes stop_codon:yes gene_type:complete
LSLYITKQNKRKDQLFIVKKEKQITKMENTTQAQNTEDKEDNLFLDFKNRKKFIEKEVCNLDEEECISCGS